MIRKMLLAGGAALCVVAFGSAQASTPIYDTAPGLVGNQAWTGSLGLDFTVNSTVTVDSLGAFTSGGAPIATDVYVAIYNLGTSSAVTPIVDFAGTPDPTGAAYVFKSISAVTLAPGNYQLTAWGYGPNNPNYNYGFIASGDGGPIVFNTDGGALTADGTQYSYSAGGIATIPDNGTTRYGAGSFTVSSVPEPASWGLMLLGFSGLGVVLRSRRRIAPAQA